MRFFFCREYLFVNIPYIHFGGVYIGFCLKKQGYQLINIGGFFCEEDIEYSLYNLKHPRCVLGHHVSLQQMKIVRNTPCDNGLTMMQLILKIIMTSIPKFTVGQVLGVFVEMLILKIIMFKTTRHIFSLIMITIEIFTVDQSL